MLKYFIFPILLFLTSSTEAVAIPSIISGHARVGLGVENWPENSAGFSDQATLGQLSLDFKTPLHPLYYSFEFTGTIKERGRYSIPGTIGELETQTQTFSFGPRYYHDLGPLDIYGGLSLTYLKTRQRLEGTGVLRNLVDDGLGTTFVIGLTDLQAFLPMIGWGLEYRLARVDVDALVDVEPKKGTWLLTTGIKW